MIVIVSMAPSRARNFSRVSLAASICSRCTRGLTLTWQSHLAAGGSSEVDVEQPANSSNAPGNSHLILMTQLHRQEGCDRGEQAEQRVHEHLPVLPDCRVGQAAAVTQSRQGGQELVHGHIPQKARHTMRCHAQRVRKLVVKTDSNASCQRHALETTGCCGRIGMTLRGNMVWPPTQ